ncbi:MAG: WD40 repeat domain-containing protein [Chloroflexi bacterium]|nr:WD40 repeat domain-containing protein [Chloroflexota bacterium]
MRNKLLHRSILVAMLIILFTGCVAEMTVPATTLATVTQPGTVGGTGWETVETQLSSAILRTPDGKCEWEVWGWLEQEVYVWAFCQSGSMPQASAASVPAVLHLREDQSVETVELPEDGNGYGVSVRRLFPPAVQEKIFAHGFDVDAAQAYLAKRWEEPALTSAIYIQTGDPLPLSDEPAVPAISADYVDRLTALSTLGAGNVDRLVFLINDRLVAYGEQGIEFVNLTTMQTSHPYQEILAGREGVLSPDDQLLAVWEDGKLQIYALEDGSLLQTFEVDGQDERVISVHFLHDGKTLAVEVRPAGEEVYSHQVLLYRMGDGMLLNRWDMQGTSMIFSQDGQTMVSQSMSGLKVWSVPEGELLNTFQAVTRSATFSADGQFLAVADMGVARILSIADSSEIGHLPSDSRFVAGVALSPDGSLLLTWSNDSHPACLWRVSDLSLLIELPVEGVSAGVFHPNGTDVVLAGNGVIGLYSISTGELTGSIGDRFPSVADLSFAPDRNLSEGARLAVLYGVNTDHSLLANWNIPQSTYQFLSDDYSAISLEYTRDPYGIAVGTWEGTVQMVDSEDGALLRTFEGLPAQVQDLEQNVWGEMAASSMNEVRIFALPSAQEQTGREVSISGGWVSTLSWTCNLVAAPVDGSVWVLDETGENVVQTLATVDDGYESYLAVPADCKQLLVGKNQSIYRWQISNWQTSDWEGLPTWSLPAAITALVVSPDDSLVAVGLADGQVQLLERETGALLRVLEAHPGVVTALDFSPDGSYLASGGVDGVVTVWGMK